MRTLNRLFYILIFCVLAATSTNVVAQEQAASENTAFKIAILDMKVLLQRSSAVESIQKQINEYRSGFQTKIQSEEDELRKARQELSKQRNILTPESYAEESQKFESRVAEVQRMVQKLRQELNQSRNIAMSKFDGTLNKVIQTIATEKGIVLVMRKDQIYIASNSLDITDEVVKRLNETLSTITVPQPGN
ncbi:MAG: OmpH family outer membrane protein [Rhodospirillales bacterium]|nr:OmpH family outer membrane protein [Rhodospirillales bacterium]